jgi:hypothetical protein
MQRFWLWWEPGTNDRAAIASLTLAVGMLLRCSAGIAEDFKKEYWATSLAGPVDEDILQGLYDAVDRGEVGWLDVDSKYSIRPLKSGINLIFYHVGGNCYIGSDCERFPSSEPTGDRWNDSERVIDLDDPLAKEIVIRDLLALVRKADEIAPDGAIVGVHVDNVHRLGAVALANLFNGLLAAVEAARQQGSISKTREVGYVAKNNPKAFRQALEQRLLEILPLYQINENARLNQDGTLDRESLIAQDIGRRCDIPIFLKTFGSDVAYAVEQDDAQIDIHVSKDMAQEMAQKPNISGVAWSVEEENYHPTMFVQGSPVRQAPTRFCGK